MGRRFLGQKLRNLLHAGLLIAGMAGLMAGLGWFLAGPEGLVALAVLGVTAFALSPRLRPQWILRMYGARPLGSVEAPGLMRMLAALAQRAGLGVTPRLYYVPSQTVNAFGVGSRDQAAIALTDGLLRHMTAGELEGVLAHEISHIRSNDLWVMSLADLMSRITGVLAWVGQLLLLINLPLILIMEVIVPWLLVLLLIGAPAASALLQLALSRAREFDADLEAARLTGNPRGLASALVKLERLQAGLFERIFLPGRRIPDPSLLRTHPETGERVRRLLELEHARAGEPRPAAEPVTLAGPAWQSRPLQPPRWHPSGLWY
jgi:heat shock protein HtpX